MKKTFYLILALIFSANLFAQEESIPGCTNLYSSNYNTDATIDDVSPSNDIVVISPKGLDNSFYITFTSFQLEGCCDYVTD